jgi:tetratricopeptide (TPR) repeat protein
VSRKPNVCFLRRIYFTLVVFCLFSGSTTGRATTNTFQLGRDAYAQNDFPLAAQWFAESATNHLTAGAFQNLGNAEWQRGKTTAALIAWERALGLNPFDRRAENNLKFAREVAQLEAPELTWCEIAAAWLPASWWAGLACGSLWFAVGMMLLPGIMRWRKSATHQALVALGLGVFLLSVPANYGVWTRAQIGFAVTAATPLRLTPTADGEATTRLAAGEPGRIRRERGRYLLIETRRASGWLKREEFALICPR